MKWIPNDLVGGRVALIEVMAWCRQALANTGLGNGLLPYDVTSQSELTFWIHQWWQRKALLGKLIIIIFSLLYVWRALLLYKFLYILAVAKH